MKWIIQMFTSKNGDPSSKRVLGAVLILAGIVMGFIELRHKYDLVLKGKDYNVEETLILGVITLGSGLLAAGLAEKPNEP